MITQMAFKFGGRLAAMRFDPWWSRCSWLISLTVAATPLPLAPAPAHEALRSSTNKISSNWIESVTDAKWETLKFKRALRLPKLSQIGDYGPGGSPGIDATATFYGGNGRLGVLGDTSSPYVVLPPGEFDIVGCPTNATFKSSVSLEGAGENKTFIKLVGAGCASNSSNMLRWGGASHFSVRNLTLDMSDIPNTAPVGQRGGLVPAVYLAQVDDVLFDHFQLKGLRGDHAAGIFAIQTTNLRVNESRFIFDDCNSGDGGAILIDNSYFGSKNIGSLVGDVLTLKSVNSNGQPIAIYPGLHMTGHGVPLNEQILAQMLPLASGEKLGGVGRYHVSVSGSLEKDTFMNGVANNNIYLHSNKLVGGLYSVQATNVVSEDNRVTNWCSGGGLLIDQMSQGAISLHDDFQNGNFDPVTRKFVPDIYVGYDDAIENHADDVQITGAHFENIGGACIASSGDRLQVTGGSCRSFNQGSLNNATFVGSITGNVLDVRSVSAGTVGGGESIVQNGAIIRYALGERKYLLDRSPGDSVYAHYRTMTSGYHAAVTLQRELNLFMNDASRDDRIETLSVIGSGSQGEQFGLSDQDNVTAMGTKIGGMIISGVQVSPYSIKGCAIVTDMKSGLTISQLATVAPNYGTMLGLRSLENSNSLLKGRWRLNRVAIGTGDSFAIRDLTSRKVIGSEHE